METKAQKSKTKAARVGRSLSTLGTMVEGTASGAAEASGELVVAAASVAGEGTAEPDHFVSSVPGGSVPGGMVPGA